MKKIIIGFVLFLSIISSTSLQALPKVGASIGQGFFIQNSEFYATPFNVEVTPSFSLLLLQLDLGLMLDLNKGNNFYLHPGVRLNLPVIFVRAALPLRLTNGFDWGFRFGLGKNVFSLPLLDFFVEIDTYLWDDNDFTDPLPFEFRVGANIGF